MLDLFMLTPNLSKGYSNLLGLCHKCYISRTLLQKKKKKTGIAFDDPF